MKKSHIVPGVVSLLVGLSLFAGLARAEEGPWTTDFEAAKAKAKAENKIMLLDFTGSDWCGFCIKLRDEVFDKDPFKSEVSKQFVLVELDFPHQKKLPDELKAQNDKLRKEFKVTGYPTICLLDGEGQLIAKFIGYGPGTSEKYLARLMETPKIWEGVLKMKGELAGVQGMDRAKLLDQLVGAYDKLDNTSDDVDVWSKEIIALDTDNTAGLKNKYQCRLILADAEKLGTARKYADAVAELGKALALEGITGEQKQNVLFKQGMFQFNLKDFAAALESMKKAAEAAPDGEYAAQAKARANMFTMVVQTQKNVAKDMEALEKAEGLDRAKLMDKLIQANTRLQMYVAAKLTPAEIAKWIEEIVTLDADNKAGLKVKYQFTQFVNDAAKQAREKKFEDGLETLGKALTLPGITPEQTQEGLMAMGTNYMLQKDYEKCLEHFKKALEAAPKGPRVAILRYYINNVEKQMKAAEQKKEESKAEKDK